ncbi:phosphotransferase family protein [Nocardioides jensenii]|uniref:phosphotransferase family protein n=1 Tax=Nocardioides jensenii TaxID=1843 RepID=UPI000A541262|nr:phosphotransferase family protein [Nocardioides jensenii]
MGHDALVSRIQRLVEERVPGSTPVVRELRALSGGLSRRTWRLELQTHGEPNPLDLILQVVPEAGLLESDLAAEHALLTALVDTPVPAARPFWLDQNGSVLGAPGLITEFIAGTCDPFILSSTDSLDARVALAERLMSLLASLVKVDATALAAAGALDDPGVEAARLAVDDWTQRHEAMRLEASPELALVRSWLLNNAPETPRRVLVHGDFKPGNVLVRDHEVAALLDWETAHLGSPLEDLGWVTNPVRRREHQIDGQWEVPQMVKAFERATGIVVDPDELRWWNVFSCFKLAVIVHAGIHGYLTGGLPHLHHAPTWLYRTMFTMIRESS